MGDVVKNKALYEDRSPINFVDQIKAPLLLLAGGHDPRCPKSETQQVVDAIKKRGGTVEAKVYENEGHAAASRLEMGSCSVSCSSKKRIATWKHPVTLVPLSAGTESFDCAWRFASLIPRLRSG